MTCCSASTGSWRTSTRAVPAWGRWIWRSSKVANPTTLLVQLSPAVCGIAGDVCPRCTSRWCRGTSTRRIPMARGRSSSKTSPRACRARSCATTNYWQSGLPHLDGVVTTNIADETSQVNALQSGQVDVINFLSQGSVAALQAGGMHVNISKTGGWGPFTMRVDQKPFDDVRVRQALRLMVDRKEMLDQVFGGQGQVGNDVFGILTRPIRRICRSASRTSIRPSRC